MRSAAALLLAATWLLHATAALPLPSGPCSLRPAARFPAFVAPGAAKARLLASVRQLQPLRTAEARLRPGAALRAMKPPYKQARSRSHQQREQPDEKEAKGSVLLDGTVVDRLPGVCFLVQLDQDGARVRCNLSGQLVKRNVRVVTGDRVRIEVSSYDPSMGRILSRVNR